MDNEELATKIWWKTNIPKFIQYSEDTDSSYWNVIMNHIERDCATLIANLQSEYKSDSLLYSQLCELNKQALAETKLFIINAFNEQINKFMSDDPDNNVLKDVKSMIGSIFKNKQFLINFYEQNDRRKILELLFD